jgi:hypothetical protein
MATCFEPMPRFFRNFFDFWQKRKKEKREYLPDFFSPNNENSPIKNNNCK